MSERARRSLGGWAAAGATLSSILSSACCWLPLLLLAAGASAAGIAGFLESLRLPLLVVTSLLLGAGFYLVYWRPRCGPDGTCPASGPERTRVDKVALWVAAFFVTAFALFPTYVGALTASSERLDADGPTIRLEVRGMTCEACANHVEQVLRDVPGVLDARADDTEQRAIVVTDRASPPRGAALVDAVERAGYRATLEVGLEE